VLCLDGNLGNLGKVIENATEPKINAGNPEVVILDR
jgi:hypothetical protein